jgi:hypothetical protein
MSSGILRKPALLNLLQGIQQAVVHTAKAAIAHAQQVVARLDLRHHLTHQVI